MDIREIQSVNIYLEGAKKGYITNERFGLKSKHHVWRKPGTTFHLHGTNTPVKHRAVSQQLGQGRCSEGEGEL